MSLLSKRKIEIPEPRYRADMELYDRFQGFSAELLKLSLAGIAVTGFFLATISGEKAPRFANALTSNWFVGFIIASVALFSAAIALSLAHRFLASDGMFHHLRAIKHLIVEEQLSEHPDLQADETAAERLGREAEHDERDRNAKFGRSEQLLYGSATALLLAATSLGISFVVLLTCAAQSPEPSDARETSAQSVLNSHITPRSP